jgi:hypothetical protein
MASNERTLRWAYELGRLRHAARVTFWIAPLAALWLAAGNPPGATLALAALLGVLAVGLRFRGLGFGRGVAPGLAAGAVAGLVPFVARNAGHCCLSDACWAVCLFACVGAGLLAGAAVALRAGREEDGRLAFVLSAGSVATLAASLGCAVAGVAGVAGMAAGLVVSALVALGAEGLGARS